jgi:phage tail-like protein
MDANGQRFWQLADAGDFPDRRQVAWDGALRLASQRTLEPALAPAAAQAAAQAAIDRIPRAVDALGCVAYWDDAAKAIMATASHLTEPAVVAGLAQAPTDLCVGRDGVLYAALPDGVLLHDLRGRWNDAAVALPGFVPWRLAPCDTAGVWVIERDSGRLARVAGLPLNREIPTADDYAPNVFRPDPENGHAPRLQLMAAPEWGDEQVVALAALPGAGPLLLTRRTGEAAAYVRCWREDQRRFTGALQLTGADCAYAVAAFDGRRIAVRVPGRRDVPAFDLAAFDAEARVAPLGDIYPLADDAIEAAFANGPAQPPHYPAGSGAAPLDALSLTHLARRGEAASFGEISAGFSARMIDSGNAATVWHRLYAEAAIPPRCGFVIWLAAGDDPRPPALDDLTQWHAHGFGRDIADLDDAMRAPHVPRAAWMREACEVPAHPGLLGGERRPDTRGLFSALIQNTHRRVRRLVGRYLWLRVVLHGDGRSGPEIAALRAWSSRFDYAERYLPRIYRETVFGEAAALPGAEVARIEEHYAAGLDTAGDLPIALRARLKVAGIMPDPAARITTEKAGEAWLVRDLSTAWRVRRVADGLALYRPQATPADFNSRLLSSFESVLTPLEDRIAAAHLLTDPDAVPDPHLEWLGAWTGVAFDPALPAERRREWLRAAPQLARRHGTRDGLRLALDIASGGGVRRGSIVVVEDFRLRRLLATLLGVELSDSDDPLLPGGTPSGNSVLGETLLLGDRERTEMLALFDVAEGAAAVADFYDRLAHRATVLVHDELPAQDFALIRRIAALEAPAHVAVNVAAARWPLLVGIASLVGVDTYLGRADAPRCAEADRSALGMGDPIEDIASLDPRLGGAAAPPVAAPDAAQSVRTGQSFVLDGSASRAAPGRTIAKYIWRRLPQN